MEESPEGLDYGDDHDKFDRTPVNMNYKEKGKIATGSHESEAEIMHKAATELRLKGMGSVDPCYEDSHKNR